MGAVVGAATSGIFAAAGGVESAKTAGGSANTLQLAVEKTSALFSISETAAKNVVVYGGASAGGISAAVKAKLGSNNLTRAKNFAKRKAANLKDSFRSNLCDVDSSVLKVCQTFEVVPRGVAVLSQR